MVITTTEVLVGAACFICIFLLVDRICKCFERCSTFKTYGKVLGSFDRDQIIDILERGDMK